jgi:S1-C subfamily serine protease
MLRTKFVLLLAFLLVIALMSFAQSPEKVAFKVTVVDSSLSLKTVPKFVLVITRTDNKLPETRVSTSTDGSVEASLPPGDYVLSSERPLVFEGRSYTWQKTFSVKNGQPLAIELSSDNAKIGEGLPAPSRREISRGGELFKTLRDGIVTIQGELGSGTGFIIDRSGLVLTSHHLVDQSFEIRARFDRNTAVKARLLAVDEERDLAILQINLSAFPRSRVLKFASKTAAEPAVIEGEQVFTIGSPLNQEKILSSGIAGKIEPRAIITDIVFNSGNSGAPLFNSLGEVVGITTFKIRDRSSSALTGNEVTEESSGLSGIVAIDEATELIAKARAAAADRSLPSAQLMPNMPEGVFPVETIKTALKDKNYPLKDYVSDVKNYEIKYMTPVYKFYLMEKDRIESLKDRSKRNKNSGVTDTDDAFRDLRFWNEYAGELQPVVQILALPETGATGKSLLLSAISQSTIGFSTPLAQKYKADFFQMKLMCDGNELMPIVRNKTEIKRELQNYYKERKRYTYAGVYSYSYEVFAPGRCRQMQVHVFSEEDIETPIISDVPETTKNRIWTDFRDFREKQSPAVRP